MKGIPPYGKTYLPRKFKISMAFAHDNCVDAYGQDIGLIAVPDGASLAGFDVLVGGGLGMTHNKPETYPRLADPLGFVRSDDVVRVCEAIVTVQRDYGDRANRRHARMKYLIAERGLAWFRQEVERRLGWRLADWVEVGPLGTEDHLGWHEQGDGRWFLGIPVENGRVKDEGPQRIKKGLRRLIEELRPGVRLTPQQNILLCDIEPSHKGEVTDFLRVHGIRLLEDVSQARRGALACPALPTCGLAITEAERALPGVIDRIETILAELGLAQEPIAIRMTGCPNGCARPYTAELAFVGRSKDKYTVYVGGSLVGTRLVEEYADLVHVDELAPSVEPLFRYWRDARRSGESFGDFCHRKGVEDLRAWANRHAQERASA